MIHFKKAFNQKKIMLIPFFLLTACFLACLYAFFVLPAVKAVTLYTSDHSVLLFSSVAKKVSSSELGGFYSCALTTDRSAFCAGDNSNGQLGDPSTSLQTPPVQFKLPAGKIAAVIKVGTLHSCILTTDQLVYCVGDNANGQLGDGTMTDRSSPVLFQLPAGKSAAAVNTLANFTCVLTTDQLVYCAGLNNAGQLGDASMTNRSTPVQFRLPVGKFAADVIPTYNHACVLTTDQLVYCAGYNSNGQLGDASIINRSTPVLFRLPVGKVATAMSIGTFQTCVVTGDQLVYCAGKNLDGQLGDASNIDRSTPVQFRLPVGKLAASVTASSNEICVLTIDQLIYCAGLNNYGQLGDASVINRSTPVQFRLPVGKTGVAITVTPNYACALTADQIVYCAGQNSSGQLGDTSFSNRSTPVKYILPGDKPAASVSIAFAHTCVVSLDQNVYCAGYNAEGQLGDGTFSARSTPVLFILP